MSVTKIESEKVDIINSAENVFNYLSDFNNFEKLMPSQVTNWNSTTEECTFTINGMATIGMKIIEKMPVSKITISSNGKVPFEFKLFVLLTEKDATNCIGQLLFESDMNPMIKMMVEKPLGNFFNMLAQRMKDIK
ncbi:MAG: SRPBCC family protein [Bacteroidetes bacterium]|nr:SRPBCC family protein [Bacteroidota bacterium]